jgi:hypothetical protein
MGELGTVLQFLKKTFGCTKADELGKAVLETLSEFGLHGLVELHVGQEVHTYSSRGACSPLEYSVLAHARTLERIFRFRSQMSIHYPRATLVVMNLPSDEDLVGRLRDHLAVLVEGTDARVGALSSELIQFAQSRAIVAATKELGEVLAAIDASQADHRQRVITVGMRYLDELTRSFVHLGLTEGQESSLCEMAQKVSDEVSQIVDEGGETAMQLRQTLDRLRELVENQ